jgi:hypothetical protein
LSHGSLLLEGEKLWDVCRKVWDEFPEETIARAYAGHRQIGNAIYAEEGGGDKFQQVKGGGSIVGSGRHLCLPSANRMRRRERWAIRLFEAPEEADATVFLYFLFYLSGLLIFKLFSTRWHLLQR